MKVISEDFHQALRLFSIRSIPVLPGRRDSPLNNMKKILIYYLLRTQGYTNKEIGQVVGRNHMYITHKTKGVLEKDRPGLRALVKLYKQGGKADYRLVFKAHEELQ